LGITVEYDEEEQDARDMKEGANAGSARPAYAFVGTVLYSTPTK